MNRVLYFGIALILLGLLPASAVAQSAAAETDDLVSLGDFARALRKSKEPAPPAVIDNDNLSRVMDEVATHRLDRKPLFSMNGKGDNFQMSSPDGTCSLSFDANATSLITDPYVDDDLPQSELSKIDGPASIHGNALQVSVYNGTGWQLSEITVGVTLVRPTESEAANFGEAKLLPAADEDPLAAEKHSDMTMILHLKGSALPFATSEFHHTLGTTLAPDQEWHWAIIQAKGTPPSALAAAPREDQTQNSIQ